MKRLICLLLVLSMLLPTAYAWRLENTEMYYGTAPHVEGVNNNVEDMAKMLFDLGLLKGRGEGDFALQSPMTREEAAVMLVRFLGGEDEAMTGTFPHPFSDVAAWADPYVGWLYQKKLTKGVGNGKYGTGNVTCWQYSTFLSRAVYGDEDTGIAYDYEIAESEKNGTFLREAAVSLSVRALTSYYFRDTTYGTMTTAGWLCRHGVFTAEQFDAAARCVLPSALYEENGIVRRRIALVDVATCPEQGIVPVGSYEKAPGEKAFVYGAEENGVTLYELDFVTLSVRAKAQLPAKENFQHLEYLASAEGLDYFVEHLDGGSMGTKCGDLLQWNGEALSVVKTAEELWQGKHIYPFEYGLLREENLIIGKSLTNTAAVLCTESTLLTLGEELREIPILAGSKTLGWDGKVVALQCVTPENTTIFAVDVETGETVDTYTVPHDGEGEAYYRTVQEQFAPGHGYYHGEAGLYRLLDGRLLQLTDLPAPVVTARRAGANAQLVILSHDLGKRCYAAMTAPGLTGDKIYMEDGLGGFTLYFEVKPEWELHLDTIFCAGSTVCLRSAQSVGMQHFDSYTYAILDGKLVVVDYEAGRPEMMTMSKEQYIQYEQGRLYALGAAETAGALDVAGRYDRTVYGETVHYLYGPAGLFRVQGGRFLQLTQMPVEQMEFYRDGAGIAMALLSRDEAGNVQLFSAYDTGDDVLHNMTLRYTCLPSHGLANITLPKNTESLQFCAEKPHGTYTYLVLGTAETPNIWTIGYEAKESMTKTWNEYLWDEMDRLHALGISDPGPSAEERANILKQSS